MSLSLKSCMCAVSLQLKASQSYYKSDLKQVMFLMRAEGVKGLLPHACFGNKGHVDIRPQLGQHSLLAVPRGEFVTDDGVPVQAHQDVGSLQVRVRRPYYRHLIHYTHFFSLQIACFGFPCTAHQPPSHCDTRRCKQEQILNQLSYHVRFDPTSNFLMILQKNIHSCSRHGHTSHQEIAVMEKSKFKNLAFALDLTLLQMLRQPARLCILKFMLHE